MERRHARCHAGAMLGTPRGKIGGRQEAGSLLHNFLQSATQPWTCKRDGRVRTNFIAPRVSLTGYDKVVSSIPRAIAKASGPQRLQRRIRNVGQ